MVRGDHRIGSLAVAQTVTDVHQSAVRPGAPVVLAIGGTAAALMAPPLLVDDADIVAFAASVENALVAAYAIGAPKLSGAALAMLEAFASHHQAHASALNATAGAKSVGGAANPRLAAVLGPQFSNASDQNAVLELASGVENTIAATYQYALENLVGSAALRVTASIMPVESQHAVVIGRAIGRTAPEVIPVSFQGRDGFFDPAKYPVNG